MAFLDLHSHVLPGLDDGAPDPETSLTMLRGLAGLGFETVCATPHQKAGQFLPDLTDIAAAHSATRDRLAEAGVGITLALGAENMWDDVFYARVESDEIPSYDDGPAFLVEFRLDRLPMGLFEALFRIRMDGKLPVIAHPERYEPLWSDWDQVDRLGRECALVVDLGAVAGYHGRKRKKVARRMLSERVVHAVASDAHTVADVRAAGEGIEWIRTKLGDREVDRLLDVNPHKIVAGQHPDD